jgi:hypothetical protein
MLDLIVCDPEHASLIDPSELAEGIKLRLPELDPAAWQVLDAVMRHLATATGPLNLGESFRGTDLEEALRQAETRVLRLQEELHTSSERKTELEASWNQLRLRIAKFRAARTPATP